MVPAFGMVILPQNLSTGNRQIPGCSCILSVDISSFRKSGPLLGPMSSACFDLIYAYELLITTAGVGASERAHREVFLHGGAIGALRVQLLRYAGDKGFFT